MAEVNRMYVNNHRKCNIGPPRTDNGVIWCVQNTWKTRCKPQLQDKTRPRMGNQLPAQRMSVAAKNLIARLWGQPTESPGAFWFEVATRPSGSQGPLRLQMGIVRVSFSRALVAPPRLQLSQAGGRMQLMMEAAKSTFLKTSHAYCYFMGWSWTPQNMWNPQCQHLLTCLARIAISWDDQESLKVNNMN